MIGRYHVLLVLGGRHICLETMVDNYLCFYGKLIFSLTEPISSNNNTYLCDKKQ